MASRWQPAAEIAENKHQSMSLHAQLDQQRETKRELKPHELMDHDKEKKT
jgi:hypothetical protein